MTEKLLFFADIRYCSYYRAVQSLLMSLWSILLSLHSVFDLKISIFTALTLAVWSLRGVVFHLVLY